MRDLRIRYWMVLLAMLVAVLLYLDRICLSVASASVERDLELSSDKLKWILSAFFWTYALAQLPAGWLGDRFGARWVLGSYVALWSLSTALLGLAGSAFSLLLLRLACGLFEAGAYPVCAGIVRQWVPAQNRGFASGIVSVGGRLGGAIAPVLTIELMIWWTYGHSSWLLEGNANPGDSSWRPVMLLYGIAGLGIALIFVWLYRDRPEQHPLVSPLELQHIRGSAQPLPSLASQDAAGAVSPSPSEKLTLPLSALLTSLSLWLMCLVQFASNFGWAFLVTLLPRYLSDVHHVSQQSQGWMQTLSLGSGMLGLLVGGWLTDFATHRWGLRYGRAIMLATARGLVAIAFIAGLQVSSPWEAAIFLALVGFSTDLGIGAMWAYGQDVGGKYVGSVMGWANMWGNLGAALSPIIFGLISEAFAEDKPQGWRFAFLFCAAVQIIAAIAACGVSAAKRI
jgi:MFS family permease